MKHAHTFHGQVSVTGWFASSTLTRTCGVCGGTMEAYVDGRLKHCHPAKHDFRRSLPDDVRAQLRTGAGRAAVDRFFHRAWANEFYKNVFAAPDSRQVKRAQHRARLRATARTNRQALAGWALKQHRKKSGVVL